MAMNRTYEEQLERIKELVPDQDNRGQAIKVLNRCYEQGLVPSAINTIEERPGETWVMLEDTTKHGGYGSIEIGPNLHTITVQAFPGSATYIADNKSNKSIDDLINLFIEAIK